MCVDTWFLGLTSPGRIFWWDRFHCPCYVTCFLSHLIYLGRTAISSDKLWNSILTWREGSASLVAISDPLSFSLISHYRSVHLPHIRISLALVLWLISQIHFLKIVRFLRVSGQLSPLVSWWRPQMSSLISTYCQRWCYFYGAHISEEWSYPQIMWLCGICSWWDLPWYGL